MLWEEGTRRPRPARDGGEGQELCSASRVDPGRASGSMLDSCKPTHVHTHTDAHMHWNIRAHGERARPLAAPAQQPPHRGFPRGSRVTYEAALPSGRLCPRARRAATLRSHTRRRARAPGRLAPASSCASPRPPPHRRVMALWAAHFPPV